MEATWEYVNELLADVQAQSNNPDWKWPLPSVYHEEFRKSVAAVSNAYRYTMEIFDPPNGNGAILIYEF